MINLAIFCFISSAAPVFVVVEIPLDDCVVGIGRGGSRVLAVVVFFFVFFIFLVLIALRPDDGRTEGIDVDTVPRTRMLRE